jgi:hypothetical protein
MAGSPDPTKAKGTTVHPVVAYLRQLTSTARNHLLIELERLHMSGDDIPGSELLLEQLRTEFRQGEKSHERIKDPARHFFQPAEPFLANCTPERAHAGQISRGSLATIWELIARTLLPVMTQEYEKELKPLIIDGKSSQIGEKVAQFHSKVTKYLESKLATPDGVERLRHDLAKYTGSRAVYDDMAKLIVVLKAQEALAKFQAALPDKIEQLDSQYLAKLLRLLDGLRKASIDATPFALTAVFTRLTHPWQIIRLATAKGRKISDIAATPYAIILSMILDHLEQRRLALGHAMKNNRLVIARAILTEIYDFEYELRAGITLYDESDWGRRLQAIMKAVVADVHTEAERIPDKLPHVLLSGLHRNSKLPRRLLLLASRTLDIVRERSGVGTANQSAPAKK